MSKLAKALTAAAGNAGESLYVEDVFSTYLYTGTGSALTITNGIDLDGEGGLVWIKQRDGGFTTHNLYDTERGTDKRLDSSTTSAEATPSPADLASFLSSGFSLGTNGTSNGSGGNYASWTFRKCPGFFDVIPFTGDGETDRGIPHILGSVPACIILKRLDSTANWYTYHKGVTSPNSDWWSNYLALDSTTASASDSSFPEPTSTEVVLSSFYNQEGHEYIMYVFADDDQIFGAGGDESIIKCGSYTGAGGTTDVEVSLGWEPQYILRKRTDSTGGWYINDVMRGLETTTSNGEKYLFANGTAAEAVGSQVVGVNPDGFTVRNNSGDSYIYIAIRRPMKTPESGTEVFAMDTGGGTVPRNAWWTAGFPVDLGIGAQLSGTDKYYFTTRLTSGTRLSPTSTAAAVTNLDARFDFQDGWYTNATPNSGYFSWMFRRAPGFMDVVCYKGDTSSPPLVVSHGLSVTPEIMIIKNRSAAQAWAVYHKDIGATGKLRLNETSGIYTSAGYWNNTVPTASEFTVGTSSNTNGNGNNMLALLFATLDGISKVGSYTGTAADLNVDCGFSAGARFILIKRTDSTGDWYVWDSVRGIVAGNDPYLLLNSTAAEVTSTDYIDPLSSGFTVTSSAPAALNASGGNYIFLAIA